MANAKINKALEGDAASSISAQGQGQGHDSVVAGDSASAIVAIPQGQSVDEEDCVCCWFQCGVRGPKKTLTRFATAAYPKYACNPCNNCRKGIEASPLIVYLHVCEMLLQSMCTQVRSHFDFAAIVIHLVMSDLVGQSLPSQWHRQPRAKTKSRTGTC